MQAVRYATGPSTRSGHGVVDTNPFGMRVNWTDPRCRWGPRAQAASRAGNPPRRCNTGALSRRARAAAPEAAPVHTIQRAGPAQYTQQQLTTAHRSPLGSSPDSAQACPTGSMGLPARARLRKAVSREVERANNRRGHGNIPTMAQTPETRSQWDFAGAASSNHGGSGGTVRRGGSC